MFNTIGFIGTGNMGSAVAKAVSGCGSTLLLANRTREKAEALSALLPCARTADNAEVASSCGLIFLCVKPQMMKQALSPLRELFAGRKDRFVLVSMAAGLTCADIRLLAGDVYPVIRMMPNTPAAIGKGVIQYCGEGVTEEECGAFETLMRNAGLTDRIPEEKMDAAAAVSGCGPAFVYQFIEAMADGGVLCGLTRAEALRYAAATVEGAGRMVLETGLHPGQLKDAVCSPGGTTIEGVRTLEEAGFRGAVTDAVIAAYEKTEKLKNS